MRLLALAVLLAAPAALAEDDAGVPADGPGLVPAPAVATPAEPAPLPAAPPAAVAAPPKPSVVESVLALLRPYATFKPTLIVASAGTESFSQSNASAVTAAANPVLDVLPEHGRFTFQVAQSRLGLFLNETGVVRGHVEFDFVDFTKASPTVASLPRLRIANVDWVPSEHFMLSAGQDWDLHAPVAPHGSNMVGGRFLSGNSGFMRQQVKAIGTLGQLELAAAVGMPAPNVNAKEGPFELGVVPSFAVRASWLVAKGRVGLSGLGTSLWHNPGSSTERRTFAGAATAFADVTFGRTTLRGEVTVGQNQSNLGLLALGFGGAQDVAEWGGFVSARHGFTDRHFVYGHAGLFRVLNRDAVQASYRYPTMPTDGTAPAMSTAVLAGTGPGILHNAGVNVGYELRLMKSLAFLLEGFFLQTEHRLLDLDVARVEPTRRVFGGDLAMLVTF